MPGENLYTNGHLIVAAIRVLEHQQQVPPSIQDVCDCLSLSVEQGHLLCRRLHQRGVLEMIEGAFGSKLFIRNHLALEDMADEVKKFQDARKGMAEKIASIKAEQKEKKKSLWADLEAQLKSDMEKKNDPAVRRMSALTPRHNDPEVLEAAEHRPLSVSSYPLWASWSATGMGGHRGNPRAAWIRYGTSR